MRSLFLKIFLTFWLAMVLVSGTLIASVVTTQSQFKAMRAEEFDRTVMPLMAARAADILDDHGMGALAEFLSSLQNTLRWQAYLFDDEGKEILSQPSPPEIDSIAQAALQTQTAILVSHGTHFAAIRATGSTGTHYVLVIGTRVESVADILRAPIQVQIVRAAAVLFIAGLRLFLAGSLHHFADPASSRGHPSHRHRRPQRARRRRRGKSRRRIRGIKPGFRSHGGCKSNR